MADYPCDDESADARRYWATYHAIRLLGELRAAEAVEPLLALREEDDDYVDQYLPKSLARIGRPAVEPLREALFAPNADVYGAARVGNALTGMAETYPELRSELVGILTERLDADVPNDESEALRAFLISDLADLRAVESAPLVRRLYGVDLVDETIIDLETFELIVGRAEGMSPHEALRPVLSKLEAGAAPGGPATGALPDPVDLLAPMSRRVQPFGRKVGRNEACPCGSAKKYKRCHGR